MRIALATCSALAGLWSDDRLLLDALVERGARAEPAVWEDPYQDWSGYDLCVIRSTWDYAFRRDQYLAWAARVAECCTLVNSVEVVRWNTHKSYLSDLDAKQIGTVPTELLPAGTPVDLGARLSGLGWKEVVLKPAIGASGRWALTITAGDIASGQAHLDRLLPREDMMIQPLIRSVATEGELSVVVIDGQVTHAVRKISVTGDFRVHSDYGGIVEREPPADDEMRLALRAVAAAPEEVLYGRVDMVRSDAGQPVIMELELVEPELFFSWSRESVERMAEALVAQVR